MCLRWHRASGDTGHRPARRKVTNLLLIPPGAPLFRPLSSWGAAFMAFPLDERVESVREGACVLCTERTCKRACMEHARRTVCAHGTERVSVGRAKRACMEHDQGRTQNVHREHVWSMNKGTHRACPRVCRKSMHGTCMEHAEMLCTQGTERACMEHERKHLHNRESVQSVGSGAVHQACTRCVERACMECADKTCNKHVRTCTGHGDRPCAEHAERVQRVPEACRESTYAVSMS